MPHPHLDPTELRIQKLERLVLHMSKFVAGHALPNPMGAEVAALIAELRERHPDV